MERSYGRVAGTVNVMSPDLPVGLDGAAQDRVARICAGPRGALGTPDQAALRRTLEARDEPTPLRPAFLRDTEKILHSPAYNRLTGKTQVFSFRADDDLTRRGLHAQLVNRVAQDIGRALGLNTDLIEAIAIGHDIGHTPFGHAGERFLNDVYHERTGRWFFHNVHSVRVLDVLYPRNLTLQTLDGVLCHNGECEQRVFETSGLATFDEFDEVVERCRREGPAAVAQLRPMTLEGCVVRISDIIAYVGKDRQDAIRAGHVPAAAFDDGLGGAYNSWALDAFIADVVENSLGGSRIEMSQEGFRELKRAKRENGEKIYEKHEVHGPMEGHVEGLFAQLYGACLEDLASGNPASPILAHHVRPLLAEAAHYGRTYDWRSDPDQTVVDFIASMTDDYFMAYAERLNPGRPDLFPQRDYFADLDGGLRRDGDWG